MGDSRASKDVIYRAMGKSKYATKKPKKSKKK